MSKLYVLYKLGFSVGNCKGFFLQNPITLQMFIYTKKGYQLQHFEETKGSQLPKTVLVDRKKLISKATELAFIMFTETLLHSL